ncbi:integrase core domain-containing protein [Arthrobacter sp. A5]|uniref:integrase core domain-containing protein n=1 Tax=Arthrobacter sp. A5 TaxID=576926 RepID=UPI003DA800C8
MCVKLDVSTSGYYKWRGHVPSAREREDGLLLELIHTKPWPTIKRLRRETFLWIEGYYNTKRRHSTLGYLTPSEYELGYKSIHELAA